MFDELSPEGEQDPVEDEVFEEEEIEEEPPVESEVSLEPNVPADEEPNSYGPVISSEISPTAFDSPNGLITHD